MSNTYKDLPYIMRSVSFKHKHSRLMRSRQNFIADEVKCCAGCDGTRTDKRVASARATERRATRKQVAEWLLEMAGDND